MTNETVLYSFTILDIIAASGIVRDELTEEYVSGMSAIEGGSGG